MTIDMKTGMSASAVAGIGLAAGIYAWTRTQKPGCLADACERFIFDPSRVMQAHGWSLTSRDLVHDLGRLPH